MVANTYTLAHTTQTDIVYRLFVTNKTTMPHIQLDPPEVERVMMGLEEILTAKNGAISDLQYTFVRTAKGYNDSLRTYTAKLKACGVPAEDIASMGFAPYTTSTSLGPAGLVVR